jgi:hypothetical protein
MRNNSRAVSEFPEAPVNKAFLPLEPVVRGHEAEFAGSRNEATDRETSYWCRRVGAQLVRPVRFPQSGRLSG